MPCRRTEADTAQTILFVDSDPIRRREAIEALAPAGFVVETAEHGAAALDVLRSVQPDVIVLASPVPDEDFQPFRSLRNAPDGTDLPILVAAGADEVDVIERAYKAGADDFVTTPIQFPLLAFRLRYMIRSSMVRQDLRRTQEQLATAQRIAKLGHWSWDPIADTVTMSAEAARILGRGADEAVRIDWETFLDHVHDEDRHRVRRALTDLRPAASTLRLEHRLAGTDPESIVCQEAQATISGSRVRVTGTLQDISERKRTERHIIRLAYHDALTGLPNRTFLWDTLENILDRGRESVALVGVHVGGLHRVVDTLGHEAGDHLLKMVAERLDSAPDQPDHLSPEDTLSIDDTQPQRNVLLARISNDGFMYVFRDAANEEGVWRRARRIQEALAEPVELVGHQVIPAACLGLAMSPQHGRSAAMLVKHAEAAQHQAANLGPGNIVMFAESLYAHAREHMQLETALRLAMDNEDLELHYQPRVDAKSGLPTGMEALLRWDDPQLGRVSPARFIGIAEETGLIIPLGAWVLRTACVQTLRWRQRGFPTLRVSVNISVEQFLRPDFVQVVRRTLDETGLPPSGLELEITETLLMRDTAVAVRHLTELRLAGVTIALDDFGTGYSSLSYLHRFPLDTLKIDRSFVTNMMHKPESAAIVRAIVFLSHNLGLRVVAEGVEQGDQLEALRRLGCEEIQGFYFSHALPSTDFEAWIRQAAGLHPAAVGE